MRITRGGFESRLSSAWSAIAKFESGCVGRDHPLVGEPHGGAAPVAVLRGGAGVGAARRRAAGDHDVATALRRLGEPVGHRGPGVLEHRDLPHAAMSLSWRRTMATVELPHYDLSIAGSPVPSAGGRFYDTVDPYSGEPWARVPDADEQDVDRAVAAARAAFEGEWGETHRLPAREADAPARRPDRARRGAPGRARDARQREAAARDDRPARLPPRVVPLLRGLGGQDRRREPALGRGPTTSSTRARSRSAWWPRSSRGTRRSCC